MTSAPRRNSSDDAPGRVALLDAAQELILDEGYAAVSARRVATHAGLSPQLVHYYFSSMDELFVQLVRRGATYGRDQLRRALEDPQPLWALWELSTDPVTNALSTEYLAVAHHRKAIAHEVAEAATQFRIAQRDALESALEIRRLDLGDTPLEALLLGLEGLARLIGLERSVGNETYHDHALGVVEANLTRLEGPRRLHPRHAGRAR